MAKVMEMTRLMSMPMSWAAPVSSETARMALPMRVFWINRWSPTMAPTETRIVTRVLRLKESPPRS